MRRSAVLAALLSVAAMLGCGGGPVRGAMGAAPAPSGAIPGAEPASRPVSGTRPTNERAGDDGIGEEDLALLWERQLMVPVAGKAPADVPDTFWAGRGSRRHRALDLLAPRGTPVIAADDGVVGRIDRTSLGGNIVYATDPSGRLVYYYAHLDRHAPGLAVGDTIRQGDLLGYVGTTGNAPANVPHLHFQVMRRGTGRAWWDGPAINPAGFFVAAGAERR